MHQIYILFRFKFSSRSLRSSDFTLAPLSKRPTDFLLLRKNIVNRNKNRTSKAHMLPPNCQVQNLRGQRQISTTSLGILLNMQERRPTPTGKEQGILTRNAWQNNPVDVGATHKASILILGDIRGLRPWSPRWLQDRRHPWKTQSTRHILPRIGQPKLKSESKKRVLERHAFLAQTPFQFVYSQRPRDRPPTPFVSVRYLPTKVPKSNFHLAQISADILPQGVIPHSRTLLEDLVDTGVDDSISSSTAVDRRRAEIQRATVTKVNPPLMAHSVHSMEWGPELG